MFTKNYVLIPFILFLTIQSEAAMKYVKGKYDIDTVHTRVSFTIPHLVISEVEGRFNDVTGTFTMAESFASSAADVTVAMKSIDTGVAKRDDDLRSKNFFEVEKYPKMTFITKSITGTPDSFKATGLLTIKDVSKEVVFDGKFGGTLKDPWGNQRASLQLNGKVNRRDFHLDYNEKTDIGPAIGDDVSIHIIVDGLLQKKQK